MSRKRDLEEDNFFPSEDEEILSEDGYEYEEQGYYDDDSLFDDDETIEKKAAKSRGTAPAEKPVKPAKEKQAGKKKKKSPDEESLFGEDYDNYVPAGKPSKKEMKAAARAAKAAEKAAAKEEKKSGKKKSRKGLVALIIFFVIVIGAAGGAVYAGIQVTESGKTARNIYVRDISIGDMTPEEAVQALTDGGWDAVTGNDLTVTIAAGETFTVNPCEAGIVPSKETAVEEAMKVAHDGNIFENLFTYVTNIFSPVDESVACFEKFGVNDVYISSCMETAIASLNERLGEDGYTVDIEGERIYMTKGAGQIDIDTNKLRDQIVSAMQTGNNTLSFTELRTEPVSPDFNAIFKELDVQPEDAYYVDNYKYEVVDEIVGCTFDVDTANMNWAETPVGEVVEVPLKVTYPKVTGDDLRGVLFRDVLGETTTEYTSSSDNRINNLNKAVEKINGFILYPGDTFSYNEVVGRRTEEAGFLPAGAYLNGDVTEEVGGGVCQISSTLYSATLYAQVFDKPIERSCHYFRVTYLDYSMDATVSIPDEGKAQDFVFKNERDYPIMIKAWCDNDSRKVTVQILGTDVDGTYVKIRRDVYTIPHAEYGFDVPIGLSIHQFRDIYSADGQLIETKEYSYNDEYYYHPEDYAAKLAAAKAAYGG